MAIVLPDQTRKELVSAIKHYFLEERSEEIGDLQASFFLDFVLRVVGPSVYNQAVKDAQASLHGAVADLDLTLYEAEFGQAAEGRGPRSGGG